MNLDINEIIKACGGRLLNEPLKPVTVTSVSTDTREIEPGALFIPLAGERFDGHEYIGEAAKKGAVCALTEVRSLPAGDSIPLIYVQSTRRALLDLAGFYRRKHDVKVIAVTGSAGKTTTKDMMAQILSRKFKTKKTIGNFNNDIGLPLSIFRLEPDDEMLVLEMGMNHAGEIHELSLTGAPDIAVITHIGDAHIENFENREGILHAKLEIVDGLKPGGTVVLNGDDPLLTGPVASEKTAAFNTLYPGSENIPEFEPIGLSASRCKFNWRGEEFSLTVPLPGAHMVMNALLASVACLEAGASPADVTEGFEEFTPPGGRLTVVHANDMVMINDVYNANPAAMKEAIKVLCSSGREGRRAAVLGDMSELGHVAAERHLEVGKFAAEAGVELLVAVGPLARHIYEGYSSVVGKSIPAANDSGRMETTAATGNRMSNIGKGVPAANDSGRMETTAATGNRMSKARYFENVSAFLDAWRSVLCPGDTVLVKASRSMAFERITNEIEGGLK